MRMSMSCAVRDMRLANSAAFSPLDGTIREREIHMCTLYDKD